MASSRTLTELLATYHIPFNAAVHSVVYGDEWDDHQDSLFVGREQTGSLFVNLPIRFEASPTYCDKYLDGEILPQGGGVDHVIIAQDETKPVPTYVVTRSWHAAVMTTPAWFGEFQTDLTKLMSLLDGNTLRFYDDSDSTNETWITVRLAVTTGRRTTPDDPNAGCVPLQLPSRFTKFKSRTTTTMQSAVSTLPKWVTGNDVMSKQIRMLVACSAIIVVASCLRKSKS